MDTASIIILIAVLIAVIAFFVIRRILQDKDAQKQLDGKIPVREATYNPVKDKTASALNTEIDMLRAQAPGNDGRDRSLR